MGIPNHYLLVSSPRPWGCFYGVDAAGPDPCVFPTPVGVFLNAAFNVAFCNGLPHARGGVSVAIRGSTAEKSSSPRPWGCFPSSSAWWKAAGVFPTPVGVFLLSLLCQTLCLCLPHARGGVSNAMNLTTRELQSSPRPWGCFRHQHQRRPVGMVFPTPVGVFPGFAGLLAWSARLPHARGGVSSRGT